MKTKKPDFKAQAVAIFRGNGTHRAPEQVVRDLENLLESAYEQGQADRITDARAWVLSEHLAIVQGWTMFLNQESKRLQMELAP